MLYLMSVWHDWPYADHVSDGLSGTSVETFFRRVDYIDRALFISSQSKTFSIP